MCMLVTGFGLARCLPKLASKQLKQVVQGAKSVGAYGCGLRDRVLQWIVSTMPWQERSMASVLCSDICMKMHGIGCECSRGWSRCALGLGG